MTPPPDRLPPRPREGEALEWATRHAGLEISPPLLSRATVRAAARQAALGLLAALARPAPEPALRCLYLHYVYDDQVERFRKLLLQLRDLGRFVAADEAVRMARGEQAVDDCCFHLSFDDGFDNNYRNAFPVLEELGVPATFFVPTRFIGASDEEALATWWTRDRVRRPTRPMRWSWLREMQSSGHEIASHTRTHARLSNFSADPDRLTDELMGSKRDIEDGLGTPCRYISWPFGTARDVDDRVLEAIAGAEYEACFSAVRGRVEPGKTSPWAIPRHHFEAQWPWPHVRYFALGGRD